MKNLITLFVLSCLITATAQERVLNTFMWSEYIDQSIVKEFEEKFDVTVNQSFFENDDDMLAKLEAVDGSLYDVVVGATSIVLLMKERELIQPLDHSKLPNLVNISEQFRTMDFDPGSEYSVPYTFGTLGLVYNKSVLGEIEPTWGVVFDPEKQVGPFMLLDVPSELVGAALKYLGKPYNSNDVNDLKAAYDVLVEAKSRAVGFDAAVGARNKILAGQALVSVGYNGDIFGQAVADSGLELGYVIPKEGSEFYVDNFAIPVQAPNPDLAHEFLNFMMDPEIAARNTNFLGFAMPNEPAKAFVNPDLLSNPAIFPTQDVMRTLELVEDSANSRQLRDELWTRLKAR
jgi:spermidine/putrescine transport system substrate-binding protein